MATPAQVAANRRNSQNSTGPSSAAGKAVSRFNALKSGIHAKSMILPGEDLEELQALAANYHQQFQPTTPLEYFLVDSLTAADWELRRLRAVQAMLWEREMSEGDPMSDRLTRLHRRIDAVERSFFRALKELQREAESRPDMEHTMEHAVEHAAEQPPEKPAAELPAEAEIGFVPSPATSVATVATARSVPVDSGTQFLTAASVEPVVSRM